MKIVIADDNPVMLSSMKEALESLSSNHGPIDICGEATDGKALIKLVEKNAPVDLVISDLRMPKLDGLSSLVYLRAKYKTMKFVLLTSESIISVRTGGMATASSSLQLDLAKKVDLLDKIAMRIKTGEPAGAKIATILEGCERLAVDPIEAAKHFGAIGYMRKPISTNKMEKLFGELKLSSSFVSIGFTS